MMTVAPNLYSALDIASGRVIASMTKRHRVREFKDFLNLIDEEIPSGLDVRIVLDNASPHKSEEILKWLKKRKRFEGGQAHSRSP